LPLIIQQMCHLTINEILSIKCDRMAEKIDLKQKTIQFLNGLCL
jgi:hypothetical protein